MRSLKRTQAAKVIEEHFRSLTSTHEHEDVLVSARVAGRRMVEIYRLLTGEMPQAVGIEAEYFSDEMPGVEFASPTERDPSEVVYVHPGLGGEPDVLIKGDQNEGREEHRTGDQRLLNPPRS